MNDLREIQKDHDAICVENVNQIFNLGGFKVEFPVYITCYAENHDCYYFVSNEKMHVYHFIEDKLKEDCYCLLPVRKSMSQIVSAGQKDTIYQQFKIEAAREMAQEGAGAIAKLLPYLAPRRSNEAQNLLEQLRLSLKGIFNKEKRQLYTGLLNMAYYAKKITSAYYHETITWLQIEEQEPEEMPVAHQVHERIYSGFAYQKTGQSIAYYSNAVYETTLAKQQEFITEGYLVSPVLRKRYCFADISDITKNASDFQICLRKYIDENYMKLLLAIGQIGAATDGIIDSEIMQARKEGNFLKVQTLTYYKHLWRI